MVTKTTSAEGGKEREGEEGEGGEGRGRKEGGEVEERGRRLRSRRRKRRRRRRRRRRNSRKSVRWLAVPLPCPSRLCLKLKQGSGPKGVDDLYFHTYGEFPPPSLYPPPPSLQAYISASSHRGPYPSLKAEILVLRPTSQPQRPKSQPQGPNSTLKGFGPQDWDLGLVAEIWALELGFWLWAGLLALRLGFGPCG